MNLIAKLLLLRVGFHQAYLIAALCVGGAFLPAVATAQYVVVGKIVINGELFQVQDPVQVITDDTSSFTVEVKPGGTAVFRSPGSVVLKPGFKAESGSFFHASIIQSSSLPLVWLPASGATLYNIYRNGTNVGSTTATVFTDTTASLGATYTYTIKAVVSGVETTVVTYTIATVTSFDVFLPLVR